LIPEPLLRRIVLGTGAGAAVGGVVTIALLPLDWSWRALLALLWAIVCSRDLWIIVAGHRRCSRIRIEQNGNMLVYASDGCCTAATICSGSLVLQHLAWLRFRSDDGCRHVELMRHKTAQDKDWRRFQVIWRHLGAKG
jgi:hypothetical protein